MWKAEKNRKYATEAVPGEPRAWDEHLLAKNDIEKKSIEQKGHDQKRLKVQWLRVKQGG